MVVVSGKKGGRESGRAMPEKQGRGWLAELALGLLGMAAMILRTTFLLSVLALLSGCASPSYTYRYVPGKTADKIGRK